jgi:hypothetical protein
MSEARAVHCAIVILPTKLVVANDASDKKGRVETFKLDPGDSLQENVISAISQRTLYGGYAVLIDTDNTPGLDVRESGATSLIDPDVIRAQCDVETVVVTPHQALAAMVHSRTTAPVDICPREAFDPLMPYQLWQIEETDNGMAVSYCQAEHGNVIPDSGKEFGTMVDSDGAVRGLALELRARFITAPQRTTNVAICGSDFGAKLLGALQRAFSRAPRRIGLHAEPYGVLVGGLWIAQRATSAQ